MNRGSNVADRLQILYRLGGLPGILANLAGSRVHVTRDFPRQGNRKMGLDKLRMRTPDAPRRAFFDELNADLRQPVDQRNYLYTFRQRNREQVEALSPADQVTIKTKPKVEPFVFLELNYRTPGGKLHPQTVIEFNPNKFESGFRGVTDLVDRIFPFKQTLKITRIDLNADIEDVPVQYFRDSMRYPKKRKSGDIGEWRKRGTETMYVGKSPSLLRIYDKREELRYRGFDVAALPEVLTRLEWELRDLRWNALPHPQGAEVTYFPDLPNLLEYQPFARVELLEVPVYDFENNTQHSMNRFLFEQLAAKQGAQAAVRILNKNRNFKRDYRQRLVNNEELRKAIEKSYLYTTYLFFANSGADVSFVYGAERRQPTVKGPEQQYYFSIEDESQIPREYLQPNNKAINKEISQRGLDANIPGVRVITPLSKSLAAENVVSQLGCSLKSDKTSKTSGNSNEKS